MLAEAAVYLATPCPSVIRRHGHLAAAVGLWSRAGRCAADWEPHYARCRAIVERAIVGLPHRRTAVVLGSGLVRDVPIDALAAAFDSVLLLDVVHLLPVRWRLRHHGNLRFVAADLTGVAGVGPTLASVAADPRVDLVVSANLLSQMPLGLEAARRRGAEGRAGLDPGGAVAAHLAELARFACRVTLLTDTAARTLDRQGREIDRLDLLRGVTLPPGDDAWAWTVAPYGEEAADHAVVHDVQGHVDLAAALGAGWSAPADTIRTT